MPTAAGAAPRRRIPDTPRPSKIGRERSAAARPLRGLRRAPRCRRYRERIHTLGNGPRGRRSRQPPLARKGGALPLSQLSRTLRRAPALLGALSRSGVGLSALELAGLEDARPGCVDRLERGTTSAQPATGRQQRSISDFAGGARQRTRQQDPGAECTASAG